jgi:hypothetical protein
MLKGKRDRKTCKSKLLCSPTKDVTHIHVKGWNFALLRRQGPSCQTGGGSLSNTKFRTRENITSEIFSNERSSILAPIQDIPVPIISAKVSVIMRFSQIS